MVTRKPVAQAGSSLAPDSIPPYPVTPIATNVPQSFRVQDVREQMNTSATDSEPDSANAWRDEALDKTGAENKPLPSALRVGPQGHTPASSQERLAQNTNNPFLQKQQTGESSAAAWGEPQARPAEPTARPPPPPTQDSQPIEQLSNLYIAESNTNPWQPTVGKAPEKASIPPQVQREDSGNQVWSSEPSKHSDAPRTTDQQPVLIDLPEPESPAWDEDEPSLTPQELPTSDLAAKKPEAEENVWDDGQRAPKPLAPEPQNDGWNLIDHEPETAAGAQQSGVVTGEGAVLETYQSQESEHAPALPPRRSEEHPPAQPPRPDVAPSSSSNQALRTQKKETYEIKKVTWHDVTASQNPRVSPILVQNANGPCPLLALVNALTLSTPANINTALVDVLKSREQVSLGLLLDAVFDELMSGRRGDAAQELPDVADLYSFLLALHTGMNVNPRFVPLPLTNEQRNSMSHVHPSERQETVPGTFEDTREMKLYSTFSIPLIHGWLPQPNSPAATALSRSAKSYEDAQNIMFHEEVLEDKLQREGLNFEEQGMLEDIATIKAFFASNATQLTPFGLQAITNSLAPGSLAILFRNDHFSTLYKHPDTLQLLQLVTDMGYAGHEEVVWESLIDVNGENAEFFSGDFRLVGGAPVSPQASRSDPAPEPPQSPSTEQEDHDLALALQLQEEEEERHRNEIARRQRETELSQQFIEQQGSNVPVSQRRSSRGGLRGGESRPLIPPRRSGPSRPDPEAGSDAPPPTYEQAATQSAYVPPPDQHANPQRRMSGFGANQRGRRQPSFSQMPGRRPSNGPGLTSQQQEERSKDCNIM